MPRSALSSLRKVQIPGNPEAGFGAPTFDGHVLINEHLRSVLGLSGEEVDRAIAAARRNIRERVARYKHLAGLCRTRQKSV